MFRKTLSDFDIFQGFFFLIFLYKHMVTLWTMNLAFRLHILMEVEAFEEGEDVVDGTAVMYGC